jgi:hypothetical protein
MGTDKAKYKDILDALTDALGNSEGQTLEEIKEELRADGIDVDAKIGRLLKAQQSISMAARRADLNRARDQRSEVEKRGESVFGRFQEWSRAQVLERFRELIKSGIPEAAVAYRDLETMETEDLKSILEDLELTAARREMEESSDGE